MASLASRLSQSIPAGLAGLCLPSCANPECLRPPTLWQRWWARHEGIYFEQEWYCSAECFTSGLLDRVEALFRATVRCHPPQTRFPLGLILLEQGVITEEQLQTGLASQRRCGSGRIGEWLVRAGVATESDILNALAVQQNCPLFFKPLPQDFPAEMPVPALLIRRYGGVPVYFSSAGNALYLGFTGPLHRGLMRACSHLMRCRVEPCIVSEDFHRVAAGRWSDELRGEAICIEQQQSTTEMARAISGYAEQARAASCAVVRCEDYLWTRLYGDVRCLDLLFRVTPELELPSSRDECCALRLD